MPSIVSKSSLAKRLSDDDGDAGGDAGGDSGGDAGSTTHLYLNVYDITPVNNYLYCFGLGIFHSGIEVHGKEYGFGAHEYSISGVFEVEPKSCPGFAFRRSVWLGTTKISRSEFHTFIEDLSEKYYGDTYHLIAKNCNHFTDEVCKHLTGKPIPGWVNRLAKIGSFCGCILPQSIRVEAVGQLPPRPSSEYGSDIFDLSSIEENDEGAIHHLLKKPNSDFVPPNDKIMKDCRDAI